MGDSEDNKSQDSLVGAVTVNVPAFFDLDPVLWFMYLEAEFVIHRITVEHMRFSILLSKLPKEVASQIRDFLVASIGDRSYESLKEAVLKAVTPSEKSRLEQLFRGLPAGNRKPSLVLSEMRQLLGSTKMDENMLRELWMQRIPVNVQAILAPSRNHSLLEVAEIADLAWERYETSVSNVTQSAAVVQPSSTARDDLLLAELRTLNRNFASMSTGSASPRGDVRRARSKSRRPYHHRSSSRSSSRGGMCWYHFTHGSNARQCKKPCSFNANVSGNA